MIKRKRIFKLLILVMLILIPGTAVSTKIRSSQIYKQYTAQVTDDGLVKYQKSIVAKDIDSFTITLDVITNKLIQPINASGATVILLMDSSQSMSYVGSDGKSLIQHARESSKKFAEEFLKTPGTKNLMGLVTYGALAADELQDPYNPKPKDSLTNDLNKYVDTIGKINATFNDTNIQAAINKARKILATDTSGNDKYILLFSDGAANSVHKASKATPIGNTVITPYVGPLSGRFLDMTFRLFDFNYFDIYNSFYTLDGYTVNNKYIPTISEGLLAREEGIDIHTVFFHNPRLTDHEYEDGIFTMSNLASRGHYHKVEDILELINIFYEIEQDIINSAKVWRVTDPMAPFITYEGAEPGTNTAGAVFDAATKTLHWSLRDPGVTPEILAPDKYKYSFSYGIKLESNDEGFENNTPYLTDLKTTLDYLNGDDLATGVKKSVDFLVPEVIGISTVTDFLHVTPLDMIAYQGGTSASGNTFPRPYFSLKYDDGRELTQEEINDLTFFINGNRHTPNGHEFFIYEYPFRALFINKETGEVHNNPTEQTSIEDVGLYDIRLTTTGADGRPHYINAMDQTGKIYDFRFVQTAQLEIRQQNLNSPTHFTPYYEGEPPAGFVPDAPTPFVQPGTKFFNSANIPLEALFFAPDVRLMADTVLPSVKTGLDTAIKQLSLSENKNYETVYLNMVDHKDGNIIVNADKPITVVYPYPRGTNKNTEFTVLHFYELNRGVGTQIRYDYDVLATTNLDNGLAFTVTGFSPFAVLFPVVPIIPPDIVYPPSGGDSSGGSSSGGSDSSSGSNYFSNPEQKNCCVPADVPPEFYSHFAYMAGYPDKTFKPEGNMTRAEAASIFSRLLNNQMYIAEDYKSTFEDVPPGLWFSNSIGYLQKQGIIKDTGKFFRPNEAITRAEFAVLAARFSDLSGTADVVFSDVPMHHEAANEIYLAVKKGWIKGYYDKTFRPDQFITRAEVVAFTNNVTERVPDKYFIEYNANNIIKFSDLTINHWAYYAIAEAVNNHTYKRMTVDNLEEWKELY